MAKPKLFVTDSFSNDPKGKDITGLYDEKMLRELREKNANKRGY